MNEQRELFPLGRRWARARHGRLVLAGRVIDYVLTRGRRRLSLRIDERGLFVGAPAAMPLGEIEAFLCAQAEWITAKLEEASRAWRVRRLAVSDGARWPVLGREAIVRLVAGANHGFWQEEGETLTLWLAMRPSADPHRLARAALDRRLLDYAHPRLAAYAAMLGVAMPRLTLVAARTRWGSCSWRSGIRLNRRLVHLDAALVDYVIAHEAAHLIEMNHGPRFWQCVADLLPDWRVRRAALKRAASQLPEL